jgi:hypothetical protein
MGQKKSTTHVRDMSSTKGRMFVGKLCNEPLRPMQKNTAQNIKHIKNLNLVLLNKVYFNI